MTADPRDTALRGLDGAVTLVLDDLPVVDGLKLVNLPLELATDFRNRWGVETSYRKLKNDFLVQSGSLRLATRMFYFKFAVLMYNMWTVANVLGAEEQDHKLSSENLFKANRFMRAFEDDKVTLDLADPPDDSLITRTLQGFRPRRVFDAVAVTSWLLG